MPVLPVCSWRSFGLNFHTYPCVLDAGNCIKVTSGAAAIVLALRHAGIGKGEKVLVPAYHCRSMVEPVLVVGATPVFYKIMPDMSVDYEDVLSKTDELTHAILVTHFFGILQDVVKIRKYCDEKNLVMIEDCAHIFFGENEGRPVGWFGDYAIASIRKFFPVFDGGYLVSSRHSLTDIKMVPGSSLYAIKAMLNILEESFEYRRLRILDITIGNILRIKDKIRSLVKSGSDSSSYTGENRGKQCKFEYIEKNELNREMSKVSKFLVKYVSMKRIVNKRRVYFDMFLSRLSNYSNAKILITRQPNNTTPYMFPLIIEDPEDVFPKLKNMRVPIWRWEDLDTDICSTSLTFSKKLLQFPCHQELEPEEVSWMIDCIENVLSHGSIGSRTIS